MQMTGEYRIPAPRDVVWRSLNDPDILKQCIPGCETVDKVSDTEFTAKVALAVGPVKAKFNGKVTLSDLDPPNGYTISGEGQGGVAGFGKGSATVKLESEGPSTTLLRYTAQATVGGKLAQVGARLIDATAKKLADEFFSRFAQAVAVAPEAEPAPAAEPSVAPAPEAATPTPATDATGPHPTASRPALPPRVWIPALIAAIAILLWLVTRS